MTTTHRADQSEGAAPEAESLHHVSVVARLGGALGVCFGVCFVTGLISHYQYHPWSWLPVPATPYWGYRVTQGVHVITGIAAIPLLLAKLWSVRPRLTQWPPARSVLHAAERGSVGLLVALSLVQLTTGLLNVLQWYPWKWPFPAVHHALAWVLIGSLLIHVAVQLPKIREGLSTPLARHWYSADGLTRRGTLAVIVLGVGTVVATTVGQVVGPAARLGLLAPRRPDQAPQQDLPVTRVASASTTRKAQATTYRLTVVGQRTSVILVAELEGMPRQVRSLPISCVEGWSKQARWAGPSLLDVIGRVGGDRDSVVTIVGLDGLRSTIGAGQLAGALLATHLNGGRLTMDHGYPVRLIAPDRPGVHQTKWIVRLEVR